MNDITHKIILHYFKKHRQLHTNTNSPGQMGQIE